MPGAGAYVISLYDAYSGRSLGVVYTVNTNAAVIGGLPLGTAVEFVVQVSGGFVCVCVSGAVCARPAGVSACSCPAACFTAATLRLGPVLAPHHRVATNLNPRAMWQPPSHPSRAWPGPPPAAHTAPARHRQAVADGYYSPGASAYVEIPIPDQSYYYNYYSPYYGYNPYMPYCESREREGGKGRAEKRDALPGPGPWVHLELNAGARDSAPPPRAPR